MIKFPRAGLAALLLLSLMPGRGEPYELSGRVSSDFYSYQSADQDHLRPYLRFNGSLLAWESADGQSLRIHSSARWTSDFSDQLRSDPQLFVRDLYGHLSQVIPRTDLYLGRQFVYNGAGSALMDGGRVRLRPIQAVTLDFFGGSSVSSEDPETVRSLDDNLVVGRVWAAGPIDPAGSVSAGCGAVRAGRRVETAWLSMLIVGWDRLNCSDGRPTTPPTCAWRRSSGGRCIAPSAGICQLNTPGANHR